MEVLSLRNNNQILKSACYTINLCMSIVGNLSPVLFLTFHSMYGISYSLLGLLILANFVTQLTIDLVFSFFSHRFDIPKTLRLSPVICAAGLLIYSLVPFLSPQLTYPGLILGTIIFSRSGGLSEVLISPLIAALPSDDPEREMSKLHSIYAWGVVFVIIFSTLFLFLFGSHNWQYLALVYTILPIIAAVLFFRSEIPQMKTPEKVSNVLKELKNKYIWLSFLAIFLGGAAESTMGQWSSSYLEQSFGISKIYGDVFGVAFFSVMLGLGRTLYSRIGRNIERVLVLGAAGATACYLVAVITSVPVIALTACALTGFCVSMLWPGNLIALAKRFPAGGVFLYALMAAGGDLGASVVPQIVGIVTDRVIASPHAERWAAACSMLPDQLGLKAGMAVAVLFPLAAVFVYAIIYRTRKNFPDA